MQFCLRVSNNALHVFPLKFASFFKYYVCKKHIFSRAFSGDLLLNEKQKKPFVSLSDEVTNNSFILLLLLRLRKRVRRCTCQVRICFAETPVPYEVAQFLSIFFFFPFCSFSSLKNQDIYLKKLRIDLESGEIFLYRLL